MEVDYYNDSTVSILDMADTQLDPVTPESGECPTFRIPDSLDNIRKLTIRYGPKGGKVF